MTTTREQRQRAVAGAEQQPLADADEPVDERGVEQMLVSAHMPGSLLPSLTSAVVSPTD